MADLPSILGGMAQGFLDFGKSAVDLFGTGGASIADLIESARTGKATTKNSDDFRKWLYDTNDVKDAAAKGLGTALNGVQTVSDYIPGIGAVTRNPLFNAGQGALGGLADEFKMYGKDYDLGRAGQRAVVGAGGALASTGLADALKGSGNALLKSGTAQGLARGAVGGAIGAGGYTAIDGGSLGDVANSALQGAGMGAALGGTMGALQDFKPAKTYDVALTDEEKAARIATIDDQLSKLDTSTPEGGARYNELIKARAVYDAPADKIQTLYHQTSADSFADFSPERRSAGVMDQGTPSGIFLKETDADIGLPGKNQLMFDVKMENPYEVDSREALANYARSRSKAYADLYDQAVALDEKAANVYDDFTNELQDKYKRYYYEADEAKKAALKKDVDYLLKNIKKLSDEKAAEYKSQGADVARRAQDELNRVLTQDGYDSVILANDKGSFGRNIKSYIALSPYDQMAEVNAPKALENTLADADMAVNSAKPAPARYIDSAGEEVPQALADYFKDASPLVRDENGNLMRFYHGTPNGDFDEPRGGSYFTPNKEYADVYQSPNASSISYGKKATNPATYEAYLDIKKPFDLSDPDARRIYIDEYVKGGNATGINPYQSNYDDVKNIDWTEVEGLKEFLEGTGYGYDSIIADEGGVPDGNGGVVSRGKSYIPFESSQVFTLKKNLAQPMEAPVVPAAEGGGSLGAVDMSGAGENSKYFMDKYGDAIAKAGAGNDPEAMAALMMKRGNKDMVRDAFTTQQDSANGTDMYRVFREYGGSKPAARETLANALTGASANPPELVGYHGVDSEKLKKAINNFGGDIINPSLQVVNPEVNPGVKYGDVILLGNKDMYFNQGKYGLIDDTGKTNAYSRDVYSPRVPDFDEKNGNRYIAGTRTPYTAENVSKYMNKQGVKSVESTWTTPGSVAATQSHRFNNLSDILDYADQLGSKDSNKKAFDDFGDFLEKKVWDYAEKNDLMGDNRYSTVEYITSELQDALKGKYSPDDYYGLRTKAGQQLISDVRNEINKLPTDYFELKMNRPVGLKEFSGAILPQGYDDQEILAALKDAGVEVLGNYDQNNMDATLQDTLKNLTSGKNRFKTPYMLGLAGLLGGGALMANQQKDKEEVR